MESYKDAATRHYEDAVVLRQASKFDNAGHLIGFAAECAIKHAISTFSSSSGRPKGHFPEFLNIARKHLDKRSPMYNLLQTELMTGWKVDRRYYATGQTSPAELEDWLGHTRRLMGAAKIKVHL
jgi:HEPN domain-containing protein